MKKLLVILLFTNSVYSQILHHQMLSAQGMSRVLDNGLFISQTIGQQSVIGNSAKEGNSYCQGFQQSIWSKYVNSTSDIFISTSIYPNPFISSINVQFSQPMKDVVSISIFDIAGRLVFYQDKKPSDKILTIELSNLAGSNYLVRLVAPSYIYYAKILKQQ